MCECEAGGHRRCPLIEMLSRDDAISRGPTNTLGRVQVAAGTGRNWSDMSVAGCP